MSPRLPAVVLVRPRVPDNLGAVARVMWNFGLSDLRLVTPVLDDLKRIQICAQGGRGVWDAARSFDSVADAVADLHWTIGTTARKGKRRQTVLPLGTLAERLAELPDEKVGLVFGTEDAGLNDDEVAHCRELLTIPANPAYTSLNLSHAVGIVLYEATRGAYGKPLYTALTKSAELAEVEAMERHLEETLVRVGFLEPDNPDRTMFSIRRVIDKVRPTPHDVALVRGICRRINNALDGKIRWKDKTGDDGDGQEHPRE